MTSDVGNGNVVYIKDYLARKSKARRAAASRETSKELDALRADIASIKFDRVADPCKDVARWYTTVDLYAWLKGGDIDAGRGHVGGDEDLRP